MRPFVVALLAASLSFQVVQPAARALAQAAAPFQEVPVPMPPRRPYGWAIATFVAGAGLVGASFNLSDTARRKYGDYLRATDPARIEDLYDGAVHYDRLSAASLAAGEALIAVSLYLGFLRRADARRVELSLRADRCVLSLRF